MEICKILTGKESLNIKTLFQLSQSRLHSNLARTAGFWYAYGMWSGPLIWYCVF